MRNILISLFTLLLLSACNAAPANLSSTREALEALGTVFPTNTPRATLEFPTREPTPEPTRALQQLLPTTIEINGYQVSFQPGTCEYSVSGNHDMECGQLTVPETRGRQDGRTVTLPVVILRSQSFQTHPDPLFYLAGGGGLDTLSGLDFYFSQTNEFLEKRDYIFYNQRGAPGTSPSLACPGYPDFLREAYSQNITTEDFDRQHVDFLLGCQENLLAQGINLASYNSAVNAADLNDLRLVLGYEKINIFGSSYGSKLGLTAMREYPEMIRSAILDSPYPLERDLYVEYPENAQRAFEIVFEECAADATCGEKYPNLEADLYEIVDTLNAQPVELEFSYGSYFLNGDRFLFNLTNYFNGDKEIKSFPWAIFLTHRLNFGEITDFLRSSWQVDYQSWGVVYSRQCNEEIAFSSREELLAANGRVAAQLRPFFGSDWRFDLCDVWQSGQADPIENQAVQSDIPALVLAGHYDLLTPATWGRAVSQNLSNSFFFEFPHLGHGVLHNDDCAMEIGLNFIENPDQDPSAECFSFQEGVSFR